MLQPAKKYYTSEEYFALESKAEYKSEFYRGEILAMAGGSVNYYRIARNVINALSQAFESGSCEAFGSDVLLEVKKDEFYTYPDIAVVCGEVQFAEGRNDTITNPLIIVEVLSPSTARYDRTTKFERYQELESFQDYILIDSERVYLEYHHKLEPNKWLTQIYKDITGTVHFEAIEFELPIERIYNRVNFDETK